MILALRTDQPQAEIYIYDVHGEQIAKYTWQAHRQLAATLLETVQATLESLGQDWSDLSGVVVFAGPGSFTGLRIGATVANTLARSLEIAIVGEMGEGWQVTGIKHLQAGHDDRLVMPEYGGPANVTMPTK